MLEKPGSGYIVKKKPAQFRYDHMQVKDILWSNQIIERQNLFPLYENRRQWYAKKDELKNLQLTKQKTDKIQADLREIERKYENARHAPFYDVLFNFFVQGKIDEFKDGLAQLQEYYR